MATQEQRNALTALYVGYFNRAPDPDGFEYWEGQIDNGRAFTSIAQDFANSEEARTLYPYLVRPALASPTTFITSIYQNLFGRAPDNEGRTFWEGQLSGGALPGQMINDIINGAQDTPATEASGDTPATPGTPDLATITNKITVGFDFVVDAANTAFTFDASARSRMIEIVRSVTSDAATVTAAQAATDSFLSSSGGGSGSQFRFTTEADNFVGTTGNDTFSGSVGGASPTYSAGDVGNGGAGTDTLKLLVNGNTTEFPEISDIEVVELRPINANATFDMTPVDGATKLVINNGRTNLTVQNLGGVAEFEFKNQSNAASTITLSGGNATTLTAMFDRFGKVGNDAGDLMTVNFANNAFTTATLTTTDSNVRINAASSSQSLRTATIDAQGTRSILELADGVDANPDIADALQTLTVTGAGALDLNNRVLEALTTLTATQNTGGVEVAVDNTATAINTGSGADNVRVSAALNAALRVNLGEGDDTFDERGGLTAAARVDAGDGLDTFEAWNNSASSDNNVLSNFERLEVNSTARAVVANMTHYATNNTIASIVISGGNNAATVNGISAAQAQAITVKANGNGQIALGVAGAGGAFNRNDTVSITVDNGDTDTDTDGDGVIEANERDSIDLNQIGLAGIETLNLIATDNVQIQDLTNATALQRITITGAGNVELISGNITPTPGTTLDGTGATGALTLNYSGVANGTSAVRFLGGSGNDTITTTGRASLDETNGGGGIDNIIITDDGVGVSTVRVISDVTNSDNADRVSQFKTTEDKFDYNGALSNGAGNVAGGISGGEITTAASVTAALAAAGATDDIVFIATGNIAGAAGGNALNTAANGPSVSNFDALETALVAQGGALGGTIAGLDAGLGTSDAVLFVLDNGAHSAVLRVTNTDTTAANTLTAAEIEVVAVFNGAAQLVAADFV